MPNSNAPVETNATSFIAERESFDKFYRNVGKEVVHIRCTINDTCHDFNRRDLSSWKYGMQWNNCNWINITAMSGVVVIKTLPMRERFDISFFRYRKTGFNDISVQSNRTKYLFSSISFDWPALIVNEHVSDVFSFPLSAPAFFPLIYRKSERNV